MMAGCVFCIGRRRIADSGEFFGETLDYRGFPAREPDTAANKQADWQSMMRKIGARARHPVGAGNILQQFGHTVQDSQAVQIGRHVGEG